MRKGYIYIDENELIDIANNYSKYDKEYSNISRKVVENSKVNYETNIYTKAPDKISNQLRNVSNRLSNASKIIMNNLETIKELEKDLTKKINSLQVPAGYESNDSIYETIKNSINLGKIDGRSVNDGNGESNTLQIADVNVIKQKLKDISKGVVNKSEMEDKFTDNSKSLYDMRKDEDTNGKDLKFNDFNKKEINKMNVGDSYIEELEFVDIDLEA